MFRDLRDPSKKCDEFRRALPDDTKIHRFARDREFLERTDDFGQKPVTIPDLLVDTESNLTPVVLRKNLYRLGFSSNQFDQFEGNINRLLMTRNRIAHGESSSGVDAKTYTDLHTIVFEIMAEVTMQVTQALNGRLYLRAPVADPGNVPTLSPTI